MAEPKIWILNPWSEFWTYNLNHFSNIFEGKGFSRRFGKPCIPIIIPHWKLIIYMNISKYQKVKKLFNFVQLFCSTQLNCLRPINYEHPPPFTTYHLLTVPLYTVRELFEATTWCSKNCYQPISDFIFFLNKRTSILFEVAICPAQMDVVIGPQRQKVPTP